MWIAGKFVRHAVARLLGAVEQRRKFGESVGRRGNSFLAESALRSFVAETPVHIEIVDDLVVENIACKMRTAPVNKNGVPAGGQGDIIVPRGPDRADLRRI